MAPSRESTKVTVDALEDVRSVFDLLVVLLGIVCRSQFHNHVAKVKNSGGPRDNQTGRPLHWPKCRPAVLVCQVWIVHWFARIFHF